MSEGGEENVAGPSRLVVVGTSQSGKKTLVKGMMSYEDIIAGRPNEAGEVQASGKVSWRISTKYYTADLGLTVLSTQAAGSGEEKVEGAEGIIVVFDASSDASFEEIKQWVAMADGLDAELRLCVGNKVDLLDPTPGSRERVYGERVEWCLENGFEYIETNAMCPTEGHAEREKDGVPRVMESIYSTRWASLEMRPRGGLAAADKGTSSGDVVKTEGKQAGGQMPAAASTSAPAVQESTAPAGGPPSNTGKLKTGLSNAVDDLLEAFDEGHTDELHMDELESVFDQIREVRETAGKYSDEDRRRRATEAAVRLAAVLGLGDGDDD